MAALADDRDEVRSLLSADLQQCGLRLLQLERQRELVDLEDIQEVDEHLAANAREIEPGKKTVWGTIHCYRAEGEA